jgi:biotin synthase
VTTREDILAWLREESESRLEELWCEADRVRRENVGDEVHLRGLVEFSNHCARLCGYCGLRRDNRELGRYRMTPDEILACARDAVRYGYGTVVLQSGEDYGATAEWVAGVVRQIKVETSLAVTLSLGERREPELLLWRYAGADRYLLRFETSNERLYNRIHPPLPGIRSDRIALLRRLREMGYEVGSGVMVGIPGQSWDDLAGDIELFRHLDLDMIGVGPYIPHPATPLGQVTAGREIMADAVSAGAVPAAPERAPNATELRETGDALLPPGDQVPNDELTTLKAVALTRLACPKANIPSTTALATIGREQGRELGLLRGANIVMPNLTPPEYRIGYEIYPGKACITETAEMCHGCLAGRIRSIGRSIGTGRGDSPALRKRAAERKP